MSLVKKLGATGTVAFLGLTVVPVVALDPDDLLVFSWGNVSMKPRLGTFVTYSDNVFYGNDSVKVDVPGQPGVQRPLRSVVDGFLVGVSPGIQFELGRPDGNRASLSYAHDEVFYEYLGNSGTGQSLPTSARQDRIEITTQLGTGPLKLAGSDRLSFLSSFLNGGNTLAPNLVERTDLTDDYRISYDFSEKTDLYLAGYHHTLDFAEDVQLYDINDLRGSMGSTYIFSERLRVFAEGMYGQTGVGSNGSLPKSAHSEVYGGFVGVRGAFTPRLDGTVKVGYESRVFPGDLPGTSAPAVDLAITYRASLKTQFQLAYYRRTGVSPQLAQQTYVNDTINFNVSQFLGSTGIWAVNAGLRYELGEVSAVSQFQGGNPPSRLVYPKSNSQLAAVVGRLIYKPRPWLNVTLAYEYEQQDSDAVYFTEVLVPGTGVVLRSPSRPYYIDYGNHRVTLQLALGF